MRSGMCLLVPVGRAGGQRSLEEQEVASERWLQQRGGRDVEEGGGVQGPTFLGYGAVQQHRLWLFQVDAEGSKHASARVWGAHFLACSH